MNQTKHTIKYQNIFWFICAIVVISLQAIPPNTFDHQDQWHQQSTDVPLELLEMELEPYLSNAIVGSPENDRDAKEKSYLTNAGAAFIYKLELDGEPQRMQKLVAADRASNDLFGWAANLDKDYAAVGAPNKVHEVHGESSGAAYIFERQRSGKWIQTQKIQASDAAAFAQFASSIAISSNLLIVGSHPKKRNPKSLYNSKPTGAVYIFERSDSGEWIERQKLQADNPEAIENFGYAVALLDDLAVVSARSREPQSNGLPYTELAYIYRLNQDGHWTLDQKIKNPKQTFLSLEQLY